jgi:hypothetical protein
MIDLDISYDAIDNRTIIGWCDITIHYLDDSIIIYNYISKSVCAKKQVSKMGEVLYFAVFINGSGYGPYFSIYNNCAKYVINCRCITEAQWKTHNYALLDEKYIPQAMRFHKEIIEYMMVKK